MKGVYYHYRAASGRRYITADRQSLLGSHQQSWWFNWANYDKVLNLAKGAKASDKEEYRAEFIRLVEMTQLLSH